jgi:hypothetical protein
MQHSIMWQLWWVRQFLVCLMLWFTLPGKIQALLHQPPTFILVQFVKILLRDANAWQRSKRMTKLQSIWQKIWHKQMKLV